MPNLRILGGGLQCLIAFLVTTAAAAAPAVILETARLTPDDGAPYGGFGRDVAIDGDIAVVTANEMSPFWGAGPDLPGAAYVYERNVSGVWQQTAKLTPQPADDGNLFGYSVAIEGNVVAVGAPFTYQTYVFEKSASGWMQTALLGGGGLSGSGRSVAIANGVIAISDDRPHGMALYQRGASGWTKIASYENGWGMPDVDYLGPDVDITGRFAVHGSWGSDFEPTVPGIAFIYDAGLNGNWSNPVVAELTRPGSVAPDGFSSSVALAGNTALISGELFERDAGGNWVHTARIEGRGQALGANGAERAVISNLLPYRFSTIHRRGPNGSWSHAGDLIASDGARLTGNSIDRDRVLAAPPYRDAPSAAYLYELPAELERPLLMQDDFQDGDANGWSTTPGSFFTVTAGDASLVYRQSTLTGNAAALLQTGGANDQSIQVDVAPRAFNGPDRWYGLVARYRDANNYYYVTARSGGALQLKKMLGGTYKTLATTTLAVALDHTNRLRLEAIGDHVRVFANDEPVIRVRDADISGGVPGLMTYKTSADFDNVVFNTNPANLAYVCDFESARYQWNTVTGSWERVTTNSDSIVGRQSDLTGGARAVVSETLEIEGNQIVQADVRPTSFSGQDRWFGLMTRYVDDSNYHYITVRSSDTILLRKLVDGAIHTFATAPLEVELNRNYRLRLESVGALLRGYVDDELVLEATDSSVPTEPSSAGVAMYKTAADVDNFSLVQP